MGTITYQITSLTIVNSIVYSDADPRHWPLCGEFTGDRWIPRPNGQLRGKCFNLMTSSWIINLRQFHLTRSHLLILRHFDRHAVLTLRNRLNPGQSSRTRPNWPVHRLSCPAYCCLTHWVEHSSTIFAYVVWDAGDSLEDISVFQKLTRPKLSCCNL